MCVIVLEAAVTELIQRIFNLLAPDYFFNFNTPVY